MTSSSRSGRASTPPAVCGWTKTTKTPRRPGGYAAVNLLVENNESDAEDYGSIIDAFNQDRKSIDRHVTQEAHEIIESDPELKNRKSTVIYNPRWMKGIVGIVASRLIETYFRPTVVLTQSNGFATGSGRSVPGFDLYQAVESCADLLENFGGHMYAAGLTMRPENVGEFTRRFNAYVEENIDPQMLVPQVDVDAELLFSEITPAFRRELKRFEPFGPGNAAPIFATRSVSNRGDAKLVGAECEHLRMDLTQRQKPNTTLQCIAFQQPEHFEWIRSGRPVDVLSDRGGPLPRHGLDAAAHQGHQAGGEIARKRIAANPGCGLNPHPDRLTGNHASRPPAPAAKQTLHAVEDRRQRDGRHGEPPHSSVPPRKARPPPAAPKSEGREEVEADENEQEQRQRLRTDSRGRGTCAPRSVRGAAAP